MSALTVTLAQINLQWESPAQNLAQIDQLITDQLDKNQASSSTDLLVLPEMFTSGFSMNNVKLAETMDGNTVSWMQRTARRLNCAVTGSIPIEENSQLYNRLIFTTPTEIHHYDKKHLFSMAGEDKRYHAGNRQKIVTWRNWRICLQVCYDLRFPVWSRNTGNYDLLLYVANWPQRRRLHWRNLLVARAIENQTHVIGVNRVGVDGNDIKYSGDSLLLNHLGDALLDLENQALMQSYKIGLCSQRSYQKKFPAHLDADNFTLNN